MNDPDRDIIKEFFTERLQNFKLFHRSPIHTHSLVELPDMSAKQCVVCLRLFESSLQSYTGLKTATMIKLTTEPLQAPLIHKAKNVPQMRKRRSGVLYEAHKDNIRMVLDKYGLLANNDNLWDENLIEELAGVK